MNNEPELPNGRNLKRMRKGAGITVDDAALLANKLAQEMQSDIKFSARSIRRFENIGISSAYGKTPPTLAELYLLLRVYSGTPSYLLLNIKPMLFPFEHDNKRHQGFFSTSMIQLMGDIASWPLSRQFQFFEFYREFINKHSRNAD